MAWECRNVMRKVTCVATVIPVAADRIPSLPKGIWVPTDPGDVELKDNAAAE